MRKSPTWTCVLTVLITVAVISQANKVSAANASPSPDFNEVPPVEAPPTADEKERGASVDIAPQPPAPRDAVRKLGYFHKYRHGLSVQINTVYDTNTSADSGALLTRPSLDYLFNDDQLRSYEVGAELLSDGTGSFSIARRWIYSRTRFRPFSKVGAAVVLDPNDQLATVLKFQHYQLRGSVGFEQLISDPISLRFEIETTASIRALQGSAGLGLAWSW